MTQDYDRLDPSTWRPQAQFQVVIDSPKKISTFNDTGGIAVYIDVARSIRPEIQLRGGQNQVLSFWETRSKSGFVTKPKFSAGLLTIRFVTTGQVSYLRRDGETVASPSIAALTGFDDLLEVRASMATTALSATIPVHALAAASQAMTGENHHGLLDLEPLADMARPGMGALFNTVRSIQQRLQNIDQSSDIFLPLLQEIMGYQILSTWPKRAAVKNTLASEPASRQLRLAIDYIEANLPTELTLAEVANSAGVSVRSLQIKFKKELGQTPVQYITARRLTRVYKELSSDVASQRSISEIARAWGFLHTSDFGQRYRRLFGCTPFQTRANAARSHANKAN